jgi:hypothetical protein
MDNANTSQKTWSIIIIAQVDAGSDWEYEQLENSILYNNARYLRYAIFYFDQNKKQSEIKILEPGANKFTQGELQDLPENALYFKGNTDNKGNLDDTGTLVNFLKNNVCRKTDRYMLITWGHGAGLGYFHHNSDKDNTIPKFGRNFSGTKTGIIFS